MKKRTIIIILLVLIILSVGGGIMLWKLSPSKEKSTSSANQPKENNPTPTPLSQLSDPELTKCLLEDFSRRLELEKYFVFGLGELKTMKEEPAKKGKTIISNWRVVSQILGDSLTKLTISYGKWIEKKGYKIGPRRSLRKKIINFVGNNEFSGDSLDQKIINNKDWYIIFEKNTDEYKTYFSSETDESGKQQLIWSNIIDLKMNSSAVSISKSKNEALEILKTDPAVKKI